MSGAVILSSKLVEACPHCAFEGRERRSLVRLTAPDRFRCPCCLRLYSMAEYAWMEFMRMIGWKVA